MNRSSTTTFQVTTVADQYAYDLSSLILSIDSIVIDGYSPLDKDTEANFDLRVPGWKTQTSGRPTYYAVSLDNRVLTLYPVPDAAYVLSCSVRSLSSKRHYVTAADISFTSGTLRISRIAGGLNTEFSIGDVVKVVGSASNNTQFTVTGVNSGYLTVSPAPVTESVGASITLINLSGDLGLLNHHYPYVMDGTCSLAYMKQDAESLDLNKSKIHDQRFYAGIEKSKRDRIRYEYITGVNEIQLGLL
jgi:hypothetical protein